MYGCKPHSSIISLSLDILDMDLDSKLFFKKYFDTLERFLCLFFQSRIHAICFDNNMELHKKYVCKPCLCHNIKLHE